MREAAAEAGVLQAEIVTQRIEQRHVRVGIDDVRVPVDLEFDPAQFILPERVDSGAGETRHEPCRVAALDRREIGGREAERGERVDLLPRAAQRKVRSE